MKTAFFLAAGVAFGWLISVGGVTDYDTVQGMFLLTDFQLYGVIGVAIALLMPGLWLAKRRGTTVFGEALSVPHKPLHRGTVVGSVLFGFGWSMTGICPGPVFTMIGEGKLYGVATLAGVLVGTSLFGIAYPRITGLFGLAPLAPVERLSPE